MLNFYFYFCLKMAKNFKNLRTVVQFSQKMFKNVPKTKEEPKIAKKANKVKSSQKNAKSSQK